MGLCFGSSAAEIRSHELAFMSIVTEGAYKSAKLIDAVYDKAVADGAQEQIFNAKDDEGDLPLHKAAMHGNPTCLDWIFKKWDEQGIPLDADTQDHNGYSPLYLVCYKGFLGAETQAFSPDTKMKRLECIEILLNRGANVNFTTPLLGMTPLHWAAYQGDSDICELLLKNGALQILTKHDKTPVDIAGFCGHGDVVMVFVKHLEQQLVREREIKFNRAEGTP